MSVFIVLVVLALIAAAVVVGAYSHKWLQAKTGAPSNLNAASITKMADAAHTAVTKAAAKL